MDDIFKENYERFLRLRKMQNAGKISPKQYRGELAKLKWTDVSGNWWTIDPNRGTFLQHDGSRWVPAKPPSIPAQPAQQIVSQQPAPVPRPALNPAGSAPDPARSRLRTLLAASPILALVPSAACGGLWFLYTFIGVFKSEGIRGVDWITPIILVGLPVFFWVYKKPIDQALMPLQPAITRFPRPLRLGVSLAVPFVLGCGCSLTSTSGYFALNVASFISIVTAAVLMRY